MPENQDKRSEDILKEGLDRLGLGYYRTDAEGGLALVNIQGADLFGLAPGEMLSGGTRLESEIGRQVAGPAGDRRRDQGAPLSFEFSCPHRDGGTITVSANIRVIETPEGRVTGYEGVFRDVTSSTGAISDLMRERENLRLLVGFPEQLLSGISHDILTPPVVIQGFVELLMRGRYGDLDPEQGRIMKKIHENTLHLVKMMGELLDFSRMIKGIRETPKAPVSLLDSLHRVQSALASREGGVPLRINHEGIEGKPLTDADATGLDTLFTHFLLSGAVLVSGKTRIDAHAGVDSGRFALILDVIDPPPELAKDPGILDRFFPAPGEHGTSDAGKPLGFSATRYLARLYGGEISLVERDPGTPSISIRLELPLSNGVAGNERRGGTLRSADIQG